ncbi:50S ribosome-binding GTPase [Luteibacter aegosomatis]|uniref:GTPase n=1 Tax=Luteibacter aegosomatis TaxID=2911537 RepID=UPI001FF9F411|nr:GTPase [Luteibacter aegosomatis]UPG86725.1 50S ribosome-binding GTPase [Luteibacter aegosomatis]
MSRRFRLLTAAIGIAALAWLLLSILERAMSTAQRFMTLPLGIRWLIGAILAVILCGGLGVVAYWLRPRRDRPRAVAPDRGSIEARIGALRERHADAENLLTELDELDRRRESRRIHIALFGEISVGKSALIAALVPDAHVVSDARGGTTKTVTLHDGPSPTGDTWTIADVPGSAEAGGEAHERIARDEALRAHAVVYVCAGDLTRTQATELRWLGYFGKPLVLVVNKADQWTDGERDAILARVRQHADDMPDAVVATSAGGDERFTRRLPDGTVEEVRRARKPEVRDLRAALERLVAPGVDALETQREQAVLARLHERTSESEAAFREEEAERIVTRHARRAIVGAMAAVAPGTDLIVQGALAASLARDLATLYGVKVSDIEIEALLREARMTVRTGTSVVLAVAGNALKAFPGLGTLGGGVLHAFAYALIFDSLGRALATTLAEHHRLDGAEAGRRLRDLLAEGSASRLGRLTDLTREALRDRRGER